MWIVAPRTRAVDDKVAIELMYVPTFFPVALTNPANRGDSFKCQLQMDGNFDRVTFVTTRSDDISSREILRSIPSLKDELEPLEEEVDQLIADTKVAGKAVRVAKDRQKALILEVE